MELNQKLQDLRKEKGLTQEELAKALFVSRTAVSKWESGRGYPNIDSLKAIAHFFQITVDDLLSGEELMTLAEEDQKQKQTHFCDLLFGLLDIGIAMLLFLPFFGKSASGIIQEVSLLSLGEISFLIKWSYYFIVFGMIGWGILTLALQNCEHRIWLRIKNNTSLILNTLGTILFMISKQPYAATFLFIFLIIKVFIFLKKR